MRTTIFFLSLSLCLLMNSMNAQSNHKKVRVDKHTENHPVRALYLSTIKAFNDGKLELFLANFSSDVKMYGTDGLYEGKDALRKRFSVIFQQFPNKRMEIPELELDILSDETVMVNFKWKLYPMGQGPAYSGVGSGVYIAKGKEWEEVMEVETVTEVDEALKQK